MIIPKFRIEDSVHSFVADDDKINNYLENLKATDSLRPLANVSGQPLHIFNTDQWHFDNCEVQLGTIVRIGRISLNRTPVNQHSDINSRYLSEKPYPIMQCFDLEDNEIIMGMLPILNFELNLIED